MSDWTPQSVIYHQRHAARYWQWAEWWDRVGDYEEAAQCLRFASLQYKMAREKLFELIEHGDHP